MTSEAEEKSRKKENPGFLKNLSYYFTEYCDNTSIHGLKFVGERKRSLFEKIWWLIFIAGSLYFCVILISRTYIKWINAPVMVTFATSETELWKIPFPAITICPLVKVDSNKFDFAEVLNRMENNSEYTEEEFTQLVYLSLSCSKMQKTILGFTSNNTVDDIANQFLFDVAPSITNTTHECKWIGVDCTKNIKKLFIPILTSGGVCFSFNTLDRDQIFTEEASLDHYKDLNHQPSTRSRWSMEEGYGKESELDSYPRRTVLTGTYGGLELTLITSGQNLGHRCRYSSRGYKIIIHHPGEIPRYHQRYFWVPFEQMVSVTITPNMMTTSEELRSYKPKDRKCFFINEKTLRFFKIYNQQNCLLECLSNFTYQKCDCVAFYMPRDSSTPICGPGMFDCLRVANYDFIAREAEFQMNRSRTMKSAHISVKQIKIECNCLPSCYSLHYDPETSQLDWKWREEKKLREAFHNKTAHLSKLRIFFKDFQFMTSERNELYGATEFWANCGGILGLFTGFSFISAVELLYFLTLRFICNLKKYGKYYWSGAEELLKAKENN